MVSFERVFEISITDPMSPSKYFVALDVVESWFLKVS